MKNNLSVGDIAAKTGVTVRKVRAEAKKGTDPSTPQVQQLAHEWNSLIEAFTGGNAGIRMQLGRCTHAKK